MRPATFGSWDMAGLRARTYRSPKPRKEVAPIVGLTQEQVFARGLTRSHDSACGRCGYHICSCPKPAAKAFIPQSARARNMPGFDGALQRAIDGQMKYAELERERALMQSAQRSANFYSAFKERYRAYTDPLPEHDTAAAQMRRMDRDGICDMDGNVPGVDNE